MVVNKKKFTRQASIVGIVLLLGVAIMFSRGTSSGSGLPDSSDYKSTIAENLEYYFGEKASDADLIYLGKGVIGEDVADSMVVAVLHNGDGTATMLPLFVKDYDKTNPGKAKCASNYMTATLSDGESWYFPLDNGGRKLYIGYSADGSCTVDGKPLSKDMTAGGAWVYVADKGEHPDFG